LAASLAFSFLLPALGTPTAAIDTVTKDTVTPLRSWLFCLAFVAFGLETNFRELGKYLKEGKPLMLYVLGQAWSLILSLLMAYLMFGVLYADKVKEILAK
ncbi:MAG: putative sulfate exporter family transporter, partial [Planctomycetota bacterium]